MKKVAKKAAKKKAAKTGSLPSSANTNVGGYLVLGTTRDGVRILRPKGKPTNFTMKELETAVTASSVGQKK